MSDYLYNLVARSFGLVETAQPRLNSIFEPPRAFSPVDALQDSARTREASASALDEDERAAPVSSASVQAVAPSLTTQPAAHQASFSGERLSADEAAQGEERKPSQATSEIERQPSGRPPATPLQPSLQRETRALKRTGTTPPASTRTDSPIATSGAQPPAQVEENPAHAFTGEQAQAEANARSDASTRQRAQPAQRLPVSAQVAEQRIVERAMERALSTEKPSALLANESAENQHPRSLSQRMKVAAFDRLQQQAAESSAQATTETVAQQRPETLIVQPQVSRYVETQEQNSLQQRHAAEPEQIVQVTIGRIEVRAAAPSPAAQARTQQKGSQQPSQSLEEYLRQRAQGGANR